MNTVYVSGESGEFPVHHNSVTLGTTKDGYELGQSAGCDCIIRMHLKLTDEGRQYLLEHFAEQAKPRPIGTLYLASDYAKVLKLDTLTADKAFIVYDNALVKALTSKPPKKIVPIRLDLLPTVDGDTYRWFRIKESADGILLDR